MDPILIKAFNNVEKKLIYDAENSHIFSLGITFYRAITLENISQVRRPNEDNGEAIIEEKLNKIQSLTLN